MSGRIDSNINNIINQSFGGNVKTSNTAGASKVTLVKSKITHNVYGAVGSGGIGKVYTGSLSGSGKNNTINSTKRYTAIVAYASTCCDVTVKHSGGTFTLNAQ
ncbi:hypothetical protein [Bacillus cereus]|uniref:hypothetical protein n=1 Tax=Bacillus cereus TaxID=1396 RepID=UPI000BF80AE6|nr:hypothetical protein [Bacillus cereus]PFA66950.1 hypothetical protein CN403_23930 [Bacillus cereus]